MAQKGDKDSQYLRLCLWTLALIAAVASAAALYFALRSHHEHLRTAGFATQLSMKEQELSENQRELEMSKSALARLAAKQTNRPANAPTVGPTPSSSPDFKGSAPGYSGTETQGSLAMLRSIYDALLTQLNLSPEQRKRFYELRLADEDSPGLSPEAEEELRKMFGARGFQFYQSYVDTEREREVLQQFRQQVDTKSLQIADWQNDRLLDALVQAGKQYPRSFDGQADRMTPLWAKPRSFSRPTNWRPLETILTIEPNSSAPSGRCIRLINIRRPVDKFVGEQIKTATSLQGFACRSSRCRMTLSCTCQLTLKHDV